MLTKAKEVFSRLSFVKLFLVVISSLIISSLVSPLIANATSIDVWNAIVQCESGGNPRAQNPHSTASGLFQDLDSTWHHYDGYARAMDAPSSVQWSFNMRLPISNWDASRSCWSRKIGSTPSYYSATTPVVVHHSIPPVRSKTIIKFKPATPDPVSPVSTVGLTSSSGSYVVVQGDTLSGIATVHNEHGGWAVLYNKNQAVVGSNPNLIYPGQSLNL